MKITVQDLRGTVSTISVSPGSLIDDIKFILSQSDRYPGSTASCFSLIFAGKRLEGGRSLSHYNIVDDCRLHVVLRRGTPRAFEYNGVIVSEVHQLADWTSLLSAADAREEAITRSQIFQRVAPDSLRHAPLLRACSWQPTDGLPQLFTAADVFDDTLTRVTLQSLEQHSLRAGCDLARHSLHVTAAQLDLQALLDAHLPALLATLQPLFPHLLLPGGCYDCAAFVVWHTAADPDTAAALWQYRDRDGHITTRHTDDSLVTVNLCLARRCTGGALDFVPARGKCVRVSHAEGCAIAHPGLLEHEVEPLQSGTRASLVLWIREATAAPQYISHLLCAATAAAAPALAEMGTVSPLASLFHEYSEVAMQRIVLRHLSLGDIARCQRVCRQWRDMFAVSSIAAACGGLQLTLRPTDAHLSRYVQWLDIRSPAAVGVSVYLPFGATLSADDIQVLLDKAPSLRSFSLHAPGCQSSAALSVTSVAALMHRMSSLSLNATGLLINADTFTLPPSVRLQRLELSTALFVFSQRRQVCFPALEYLGLRGNAPDDGVVSLLRETCPALQCISVSPHIARGMSQHAAVLSAPAVRAIIQLVSPSGFAPAYDKRYTQQMRELPTRRADGDDMYVVQRGDIVRAVCEATGVRDRTARLLLVQHPEGMTATLQQDLTVAGGSDLFVLVEEDLDVL